MVWRGVEFKRTREGGPGMGWGGMGARAFGRYRLLSRRPSNQRRRLVGVETGKGDSNDRREW
jgi:hypothetical protein